MRVFGRREPRRHRAIENFLFYGFRPRPRVGIRDEGHRCDFAGTMTLDAAVVKDRSYVLCESRLNIAGIVCGDGGDKQKAATGGEQAETQGSIFHRTSDESNCNESQAKPHSLLKSGSP